MSRVKKFCGMNGALDGIEKRDLGLSDGQDVVVVRRSQVLHAGLDDHQERAGLLQFPIRKPQ